VFCPRALARSRARRLQLLTPAYGNEHARGQFGPLHTVEAYHELLLQGLGGGR
jgi:hypothetical protein